MSMDDNSGFFIIEHPQKRNWRNITPVILSAMTAGSICYSIIAYFYPKKNFLPFFLTILMVLIFQYFMSDTGKKMLISLAVFVGVFGVTLAVGYTVVEKGWLDFLNRILVRYNYITGNAYDYFNISTAENMDMSVNIFLIILTLFITFYFGMMIQRKHPVVLLLCYILIIMAVIYLELSVGIIVIVCAAVSILGTFAYCQVSDYRDRVYAVSIGVLSLILAFGSGIYVNSGKFKPLEIISEGKDSAVMKADILRYGEIDSPQGSVGGDIGGNDKTRLEITVSDNTGDFGKEECDRKIYLKGYTAGELENHRWNILNGKKYSSKYEGMIKGYTKKGYHPLSQLGEYLELVKDRDNISVDGAWIDVSVKNVSAYKRFAYIPYGMSYKYLKDIGKSNQDMYIYGDKEKNDYEAQICCLNQDVMLGYSGENWIETKSDFSKEAGEYRAYETDYRNFVYKFYLNVSKKIKEEAKNIFKKTDVSKPISVVNTLREHFEKISTEKKYNSVNYTSQAVQYYRAIGVPARYVEGYVANGKDTVMSSDGKYHIDVKAKNAHAWVEIYRDGIGWVPVEVTPGYYKNIKSIANQDINPQSADSNVSESQTEQDEKQNKDNKSISSYGQILVFIIAALIVLLIVFIAAVLLRRYVIIKMRNTIDQGNDLWMKLELAANVLGLIYKHENKNEDELPDGVKNILNAYRFSTEPEKYIGESDINDAVRYMKRSRESLYKNAGFSEKIKMMFIEVI